MSNRIHLLEIGADSFLSNDNHRRILHKERRLNLSKYVAMYHLVLYSDHFAKGINIEREQENLIVYRIGCFKYLVPFKVLQVAFSIFKKNRIDLISAVDPLLCGFLGYLLKIAFRVPLNVQLHFDYFSSYFWEDQNFLLKLIRKQCIKKVLQNCDSVRAVSSAQKRFIENKFRGIKVIEIVPTPLDTALRNLQKIDGTICDKYRSSIKTKLLIYVGRLEPSKDLNTLLKAMCLIKDGYEDVKLLIIGIGSKEGDLKRVSKEMNLEQYVVFLGSISNEKLFSYYCGCDVFVFSSKHEGRGTVLVEAGLSKKPIVVTRFSSAQELIVDGETGFIVNIGDYKTFAEKVLVLLNDPQVAIEFGYKSYEHTLKMINSSNNIEYLAKLWEKTVEVFNRKTIKNFKTIL